MISHLQTAVDDAATYHIVAFVKNGRLTGSNAFYIGIKLYLQLIVFQRVYNAHCAFVIVSHLGHYFQTLGSRTRAMRAA